MKIVIIAGSILLFLTIVILLAIRRKQLKLVKLSQQVDEYRTRETRAIGARATIIDSHGGIIGESKARIELTLKVMPESGEQYSASTLWLVDVTALGNVQQGQAVQIKIDADDLTIIYPNSSWATYIVDN